MRPTIVYGVQSAVHRPQTLTQLVDTLAGQPVLIHHDFVQQPDMVVDRPNVHFVPQPEHTGWGDWGFMLAILRTVRHALEHMSFDYFQLLSPVDLPVRPIAEFEAHVARDTHDAAIDHVFLDEDEVAFMSYAYRMFLRPRSPVSRVQWRLCEAYFVDAQNRRNRAGLSFPVAARRTADGRLTFGARSALWLNRMLYERSARSHADTGRQCVGGTWFGANRKGCEALIRAADRPGVNERFAPIFAAAEVMPATLLANAGLRLAPGNLLVSRFDHARPRWLGPEDLPEVQASGRYFARKFPDDPDAPVRRELLARLQVADEMLHLA